MRLKGSVKGGWELMGTSFRAPLRAEGADRAPEQWGDRQTRAAETDMAELQMFKPRIRIFRLSDDNKKKS